MSESGSQTPPDDAMLDLLTKQVTEGLASEEQRALDGMDSAMTSAYARDLERAAAAISLAATASSEELLPPGLRVRIEQDAQAFFAGPNVNTLKSPRVDPRAGSRKAAAGWFAAAACLVLAVFGWLRPPALIPAPSTSNLPIGPPPIAVPPVRTPVPPTPAEERAALLALPESVKVSLSATKDPAAAGVTADAVWDPATQRGFLRIVGLKPNDSRTGQYQAWVFDAERDKRYPLDAGVFDVPPNSSEVIVPIRAELPVHVPKAFAVTLEKPGGVVVSALRHVVVLGTVDSGRT